jgi:actin-related protein 6
LRALLPQIIFEDYGFCSCLVALPAALSHHHFATTQPGSTLARGGSSLVLDCGFSFSHAVPIFDGFPVSHAIRRLNLGGKALTNFLKELVSYR